MTSTKQARDFDQARVRSADGTTIGYRIYGRGPALVLMHGGMLAAQNLTGLAHALSDARTVVVPDRRGRGTSGPHGPDFHVTREVQDLQAIVRATGARDVFGLSTGALVTLRTALATPALDRIALYEPPLSVDGSAPVDWQPRYEREIAAGRLVSALVTIFKGLRTEPFANRIPRPVLVALLAAGARLQRPGADEAPIADLIPTMSYDLRIIRDMADTAADYKALQAQVLLMGGSKSPAYFTTALDELTAVLPHSGRVTLNGLGHSGPENDEDPTAVAAQLRTFFTPEKPAQDRTTGSTPKPPP
ncbi:alpha/beta fold hydrolase [Actinomadura montaniterrae]|uniref:Alpha/beta hydrolase n=1 Tax=Actinomadura montaniterrae TaxID=1803903 RepID=A0A6L3VR41_9ACTN|nr:alpha/beta hydrolase [Actinomadura montaniterrae]KAB2379238.1 alpha/beta hydrolase [Actinomadura montaniterrae]